MLGFLFSIETVKTLFGNKMATSCSVSKWEHYQISFYKKLLFSKLRKVKV